jgi:copper chaperone NosL
MSSRVKHSPTRLRQHGFAAAPLLILVGLIVAVVLFVFISNRQSPSGPKEVIWDKSACAYCAMHLGDPRFAAQLSTADGETYFYDDPGCLFLHQHDLEISQAEIHARWFNEMTGKGWIEAAEVAFARCENTPMDYGFGAVAANSPDAIGLEQAAAEVLAK